MQQNRGIFLDRDGVINIDPGYVGRVEDFKVIKNTPETLKTLQEKGFLLFIVSNQSGVGRGYFSVDDVMKINSCMLSLFNDHDINISEIHYCYHAPNEGCICRKPNPTKTKSLVQKYNIDLHDSYFISDTKDDLVMAKKIGLNTVWLKSNIKNKKNDICFKPDYSIAKIEDILNIIK